jgi:hypothetical protein
MNYQSLENNLIANTNMTHLEDIFPNHNIDNNTNNNTNNINTCYHCNKTDSNTNNNTKQSVLNRGIYSDLLEPEYYRYNKSLHIDVTGIDRKYIQYKPRRPKCPIIFRNLFPHNLNKSHLISNPLYSYPITEETKKIENKWQQQLLINGKKYIKNIHYMMDEYDNAYIVH